jgi:NADH:ubiquinone oxidoreductase subunit F (NADH-binding)
MNPNKMPTGKRKARRDNTDFTQYASGGGVNAAGNYIKPGLRKNIVSQVKSAAVQGTGAGQWSARKAQLVAKKYKAAGGSYKD